MAPDLNSLPSSRPPSVEYATQQRPRRISSNTAEPYRVGPPSPRSPTASSLGAVAQTNAGFHRSPSGVSPGRDQGLERRRSGLINNLSINDPTVPTPGEMQPVNGSNNSSPRLRRRSIAMATADPHHHRQPSLGELHQELESEQEAQVNRLLHMIRIQQDQLAAMQRQQQQTAQDTSLVTATEHIGLPTPPSSTSTSFPVPSHTTAEPSSPRSTLGSSGAVHQTHSHFNRPPSLSRQSSARQSINANNNNSSGSRGTSPALRPTSGNNLGPLTEDFLLGGTRDESAFYQAETQTLTRENQMLKLRIRELERQIADMSGPSSSSHPMQTSVLGTFAGESAQTIQASSGVDTKAD